MVKRNVLRWTFGALLAVGAVVLIAWIGGAFDSEDAAVDVTVPLTLPSDATLPTIPVTAPTDTTPAPPKPDVVIPAELPTELVVTDLEEGAGEGAQEGDIVTVHYVGVRSEDGTEFDNSYDRGTPFPVVLGSGGVIAGWEQGLIGVKEGGRRQLDIPTDLAYGDSPRGDIIQPGDALTFVIDVVSVQSADAASS